MPKTANAKFVHPSASRPVSHRQGLYLFVSGTCRKSWVFRYQRDGDRHDCGLGAYPDVSLTEARRLAYQARQLLASGRDPISERRAAAQPCAAIPTFAQIASEVISQIGASLGNEKNLYRARLLLGPHYCPSWQNRLITNITTSDVALLLNSVATQKPETARKLHGHLAKVFDAASVILPDRHGVSLENPHQSQKPEKARLRGSHPQPAATSARLAASSRFFAALRSTEGVVARALEAVVLTGLRESAVVGGEWTEVCLETGVWTIPLARLKDRHYRQHPLRIPISSALSAILKDLKGGAQTLDFPGPTSRPPPQCAVPSSSPKLRINNGPPGQPRWVDPDSKRPIVVHGFRATLKTWGEDNGFRYEVTELSLGHAVGGSIERRYRRTDLLEERARFLEAWADHCQRVVASNVVALRG